MIPCGVALGFFVMSDQDPQNEPVKLTRKRQMFVEAYLRTWSGTEAAREAGYKWPTRQGWALLQDEAIQRVIADRIAEAGMSANEVIARLADQARASLAEFLVFKEDDQTGELTMAGVNWQAVRSRGHLIKTMTNRGGFRLELHDSQAALDKLAKVLTLYTERLQIESPGEVRFYLPENGRNDSAD